MRRAIITVVLLSLALIACQGVTILINPSSPISTPTPLPSVVTTTPQLSVKPQTDNSFRLVFHPDGGLYVGDQVSMEVIAPTGENLKDHTVQVTINDPARSTLGPVKFEPYGIAARQQATLLWAWDTSNLPAGSYTLTISVAPDGPTWTQSLSLMPRQALPSSEANARWSMTQSDCCQVYYITHTAAERDLPSIISMAQNQAEDVSQKMGANFSTKVPIVLIPRVLGHGGFTDQEISVSYLDGNYAGDNTAIVLHHEMVHFLDGEMGGDLRPSILVEGLAVYMSGGHYKPEPLLPRAAALLDLGWYIPLTSLAENFYTSQHEIGYLEAGALVSYMITRWGWDAFNAFYRDIHTDARGGGQVASLNEAILKHFHLTLAELENDFLQQLRQQPLDEKWVDDVRLTVHLFDTVRRYQQDLDPSAYYLTAWLPDGKQMRERGIVADYLRHPTSPENQAIETLLKAAFDHLEAGDYPTVERLLEVANAALQAVEAAGVQR